MATITFYETRRHGSDTTSAGAVAEVNTSGSIRFHNDVDGDIGATDSPLIRPSTGSNYSFNKFIDIDVAGAFTSISSPMVSVSAGVDATGEVGDGSMDVFLLYGFQRKGAATGVAIASTDFGEVVDGSTWVGSSTGITTEVAPAVWTNASTPVAWGGVSTFTSADRLSHISATQATDGDEYLNLQLRVDSTVATGGALPSFSLTFTYNEV